MGLKEAAVSWTGGKDSALACYEACLLGYKITNLVTFVPDPPQFLAHPLHVMKYQAEALDLPHVTLTIHEPFKESYGRAIDSLRKKYRASVLITGDITEVDGLPNWIRECSATSGMEVFTPLWGRDRLDLLRRLISSQFKVIFSCVKSPWLTENWLGRQLDQDALEQLCRVRRETGLDLCGEQGEYHTMVLDGPPFKKRIRIRDCSKHIADSLMYLDIHEIVLEEKSLESA